MHLLSLAENLPHALMISCDTIATIFSCACTTLATYSGEHKTSCVEAPEDTWPTILSEAHCRSKSPCRASHSPHVFKHPEYSSTIFKHAFTKYSHNRADNLSLFLRLVRRQSAKTMPCLHRSGPPGAINHPPHAHQTSCDVKAIFDHDCTKCDAHSGEHPTSCVGTSEDIRPTIFDYAYTEVIRTTWQEFHLMLKSTCKTHLQSKNM
jgi:hypothetical protein